MKPRTHPAPKKKPLDYPEETEGSRLAAKGRQMANLLTAEERREHFRRGMVRIYGGVPKIEAHLYDFQIRVLLYREDGEFVAHALEMDLLGYGKTEAAALRDLEGLIESQITFARQKNDDTLLDFPAPKDFFARWEKAHASALKRQVFPDKSVQMAAKAVIISLDERIRRIQNAPAKQFRRLTSPVCA